MFGKERSEPPLSFGEAGLLFLGRSPGSGFLLFAAPSRRFVIRVSVIRFWGLTSYDLTNQPVTKPAVAFALRLSWPLQWRDRTGFAPVSLLSRVGT
jgi:hypothetical protein